MKNRKEEITSWKPLTRREKFRTIEKVVLDAVFIGFVVLLEVVLYRAMAHNALIQPFVKGAILFFALAAGCLFTTCLILDFSDHFRKVIEKLELEKQAIVYWLGPDHGNSNALTFRTSAPVPMKEALRLESPFMGRALKIIIPLRRGEEVLYFHDESSQLKFWRFDLVEAFLESNRTAETKLSITDQCGNTITAPIGSIVRMVEGAIGQDMAELHFGDMLVNYVECVSSLERTKNDLGKELGEANAALHRATNALIEGVNVLRNRQKFPRSRNEARNLAITLHGALISVLSDTDPRHRQIISDTPTSAQA